MISVRALELLRASLRDFGAEEETVLAESFDRPVFVTHYPFAIKAFYMKQDPENPYRYASAFELMPFLKE